LNGSERPRSEPLPAELEHALDREPRLKGSGPVHYFAEVHSTNDVALALASAGGAAGTAVLAEHQRAGRGRRGRTWYSPAGGGLYLSVVARPGPDQSPLVTLAAGVAAAGAIRAVAGLPVELKWPNDLVVGRPWRKLGGVLCESMGTGGRVEAVVVGMGINVRSWDFPPDLGRTATSIEAEVGRAVDRAALVVELLAGLRQTLARLDIAGPAAMLDEWRRYGEAGLGGAVSWRDQGLERRGRARDVDRDGALLVESNGRLERLIGGDVQWERLA
jgi:BirA family biotin operon repressor/biotin-[acetyl-CoA-carboxylase] ligase